MYEHTRSVTVLIMITGYVIYYRVSTKQQGKSGLGLEAQQSYIRHYIQEDDIKAEFTEVMSGKTISERSVLREVIQYAKDNGLGLAVAKIDRLSRKTEDALAIYQDLNGYLFSCDIPTERFAKMDKFTLTIFMAIADRERELIGIRTKQALDAKKARDNKEWRNIKGLTNQQRQKNATDSKERAIKAYQQVVGYAKELHGQGMSFRDVARRLNSEGFKTRKGVSFQAMTVKRILDRGMV